MYIRITVFSVCIFLILSPNCSLIAWKLKKNYIVPCTILYIFESLCPLWFERRRLIVAIIPHTPAFSFENISLLCCQQISRNSPRCSGFSLCNQQNHTLLANLLWLSILTRKTYLVHFPQPLHAKGECYKCLWDTQSLSHSWKSMKLIDSFHSSYLSNRP